MPEEFATHLKTIEPVIIYLSKTAKFKTPLYSEADDIAQQIRTRLFRYYKYFLKYLPKLKKLYGTEDKAFKKWSNRTIRNLFYDLRKREAKEKRVLPASRLRVKNPILAYQNIGEEDPTIQETILNFDYEVFYSKLKKAPSPNYQYYQYTIQQRKDLEARDKTIRKYKSQHPEIRQWQLGKIFKLSRTQIGGILAQS